MSLFWMANLLLFCHSLFKIVLIMKYINSVSFCTKIEVHKASRSIFTLTLIWSDSQAKSMIFFDYEIPFFGLFLPFSCKKWIFEVQNVVYLDLIVVRTWFLIQEESEIVYFSENENLKKGGQRGGRAAMFELTQWLCKKIQIWPHLKPSEPPIMV